MVFLVILPVDAYSALICWYFPSFSISIFTIISTKLHNFTKKRKCNSTNCKKTNKQKEFVPDLLKEMLISHLFMGRNIELLISSLVQRLSPVNFQCCPRQKKKTHYSVIMSLLQCVCVCVFQAKYQWVFHPRWCHHGEYDHGQRRRGLQCHPSWNGRQLWPQNTTYSKPTGVHSLVFVCVLDVRSTGRCVGSVLTPYSPLHYYH